MMSKTHDLAAFAALLSMAVYYPPTGLSAGTALTALIGNIVGALLPDLDQATNRLWDLLPGGNYIGKALKNIFFGHRTLTHSLVGIYLVYRLLIWLTPKLFNSLYIDSKIVTWAVMIGYLSHLLADCLTEEGLPLLFPFKWKFGIPPIKRMRIKTGKWFEKWVVFPAVGLYILVFGLNHWEKIWELLKTMLAG